MIRRKKPKRYRDLPGRSMVPPPSPILSTKKKRKKKKKKKKKPPPLVTGRRTRVLEPGTLRIYEDPVDDSTFQIFEDSPRLPRPQFSPVSSPRRQTERPLPQFSPLSSPRRQTERIRPRPLFSEEKDDPLLISPLSSPLIGGLDDRLTLTPPPLRLSPTQSPRRTSRSPTPRGPIRRLNF